MKKKILLAIIVLTICLVIAECLLRAIAKKPEFEINSGESTFWERDKDLGWKRKPYSEGYFSNGYFRGYIKNDKHGNRLNSDSTTYIQGYKDIFFIGDSTTASLEVNNNQTVPAILEDKLRKSGYKINVLNLGVRGYGTDQSVRKALNDAKLYNPVEIIYMYCDNDIFDNNILKQPKRKFGKGVYLDLTGKGFSSHNYPVPDYPEKYAGCIIFDKNGKPFIKKGDFVQKEKSTNKLIDFLNSRLNNFSFLYRRLSEILIKMKQQKKTTQSDISNLYNSFDVKDEISWHAMFNGLVDSGLLRERYKNYYNNQLKYILEKLRKIPSVNKVHLVEFPSSTTIELMSKNKLSTNKQLFESMQKDKIIDSYINLNELITIEDINLKKLECYKDSHFNIKGNQWITQKILENTNWNFADPEKE